MIDGNKVEMCDAGTFRKTATVKAKKLAVQFTVETAEGVMTGNAGDYLCEGIEGERWPVKQSIFEQSYERTDPVA